MRIFGLKWPWTIHLLSSGRNVHHPAMDLCFTDVCWLAAYHSTKLEDIQLNDMGNSSRQEIACKFCGELWTRASKGVMKFIFRECWFQHVCFTSSLIHTRFFDVFLKRLLSVFESFSVSFKQLQVVDLHDSHDEKSLLCFRTSRVHVDWSSIFFKYLDMRWLRITFKHIPQYMLRLVAYVSNYVHRGLCRFMYPGWWVQDVLYQQQRTAGLDVTSRALTSKKSRHLLEGPFLLLILLCHVFVGREHILCYSSKNYIYTRI